MQTLLVGLDAVCFPVLEPLFEDGDVPNLEALFAEGATGVLESQVPPWTASAWPSLYTGANPGKHGVFDFLRFDGYDWDIVNATDVRQRTLWEYADAAGLTSVVVNAPVTSPPPEINGAVIPGYLAAESPPCHPDGVLKDVRDELGDYRVYAERETGDDASGERFADYLELCRMRGEAFRYLSERFDPEFGFVQFQKTDAVFHDYPGDREKVRDVYRAVDEQVGAILDDCDPDTVVVASDHGMGEYDGYEFRVNDYLREHAVVETTRDGRGVPSWFQIKDEELTSSEGEREDHPFLERLAAAGARVGITHQRGKRFLERFGLATFVGKHVPVGAVFAATDAVDFATSTAYLRSPSELGVRLNVAGRDPEGVVPEGEYEQVRADVIDLLERVETPDGDPVFESVVPREEHIHGPYAEEAVDVLAVPTDFEHSLSALVGERFDAPEPWNHKLEGVVAVAGEGADADADLAGAHLFDVAPTVLATLDLAPAEVMDGSALPAVDAPSPRAYDPYDASDHAATEDAEVAQRLSDLGYLE
ncbi:phosphodiesterase [Halorubellus sp. JP-L1]|uniref:alkaline phosphatase family protein n=1 Tax=Halorubellus sp. JP-L1 TaxID=2715753 RepID=UPI00140C5CBF|nr:alkaline phosphatase family protein [Halorubellus sp. JP-L1]NHN41088.1 phosphodiesterase [Halorubellus sp. JP-L1]